MTKEELLKNEVFKKAPSNAMMVYENFDGESYIIGSPVCRFKNVVRFTNGVGITKEELLKDKFFRMANMNAKLELSQYNRIFMLFLCKVIYDDGFLIIKEFV